jgi:hypothetical protein
MVRFGLNLRSNNWWVDFAFNRCRQRLKKLQQMDIQNGHKDQQQQLQQMDIQNGQQCFDYSSLPNSPYPRFGFL